MNNFIPTGVCAKNIEFSVENNIIKSVKFTGGCNGNLQGISRLVEGLEVSVAISKLSDIKCGARPSSCPAQLALALQTI